MAEQDTTFGPNAWLVDEMYEQYRADPSSVSESWRDFFADERDGEQAQKTPTETATETAQEPAREEPPAPKKAVPKPSGGDKRSDDTANHRQEVKGEPIRGAAARI